MSILIQSRLTEENAICTLQTGIVLASGERIGAQADIDVFAEFSLETEELGQWVTVTDAKGGKRKMRVIGQLWDVQQKRGVKQRYEKTTAKLTKAAERNSDGARAARVSRLAAMAEEYEARGVSLFGADSDSEELTGAR